MVDGKVFKEITNEDIYEEIQILKKMANFSKTHIKVLYATQAIIMALLILKI